MKQAKPRKGVLFTFATAVAALAMASTALACVTFKGEMTVGTHDGSTTVVGVGNNHAYCPTGKPTTAAAGHRGDRVDVAIRSAVCDGRESTMEDGTYQVKFNNKKAYTFDGTYWVMEANTGCFWSGNSSTTSDLGTLTVTGGSADWFGPLSPVKNDTVASKPGEAANFCVGGNPNNDTGMLAPFRYLGI